MSDEPIPTEYIPARAMVIVAHPDDIEFGCAGTIARWVRAGCEVCYVVATSGDAGIDNPDLSRAEVAVIREAEQQAAATITGVSDLVFLHEPDGLVVNTLELRERLVREIRRFRPEVVMTMDPTALWFGNSYINHPDHRAVSGAAVDAVFPAAGQPHVFPEHLALGYAPHKVRKLYVIGFGEGETMVDITDTFATKIQALRAHASQMGDWDPEPMIREWAAEQAKDMDGVELAEGFRVMTIVSDEDWAKRNGGSGDS